MNYHYNHQYHPHKILLKFFHFFLRNLLITYVLDMHVEFLKLVIVEKWHIVIFPDLQNYHQQGGHLHNITILPIILPIICSILSHTKNIIISIFFAIMKNST